MDFDVGRYFENLSMAIYVFLEFYNKYG